MTHCRISQRYCIFRLLIILFTTTWGVGTYAATTQKHYFAHDTVEDKYGVIAPWYNELNGQCDFRVRVAAETLKRYPWTDPDTDVVGLPAYMVNGRWQVAANGDIKVIPLEQNVPDGPLQHWNNGDYGQRTCFVLNALVDYYRYSGDPAAIAHITMQIDHLLNYTLTDSNHPWPNFPISVPVKGEGYHYYDPNGFMQLDIAAQEGMAMLRAYQVVGEARWFAAAKHWGDLFAAKMNTTPGQAPWDRYATVDSSPHWDTKLTGGVAYIQEFLDELIRLGYTGDNNKIIDARNACRTYLHDTLLPVWTVNDTWARNYWDGDCGWQGIFPTDSVVRCLMADPEYFTNWRADVRNILSLFLNRTGADPDTGGDTFSGAWAYPESFLCCRGSFDYSPMAMAGLYAQYGVLAASEWSKEMARRQMILTTYHFHENGIVEDLIDGGIFVAAGWFKIAQPMAFKAVLDTMAWQPDVFGANRENHIMRTNTVVNSVVYAKDKVTYSTFNAPANTVDILRLAFIPTSITANGTLLKSRKDLSENGYLVRKLPNGDSIVSIRHDGSNSISVTGKDPQTQLDDTKLRYAGNWIVADSNKCFAGKTHMSNSPSATATMTFIGNQVRLIGQVDPNGGLADVYIDNVKQPAGIDYWNPSLRHQQVVYYKNGLSDGKHELKVVVCGNKNPNAAGSNVYIDALQYSDAIGECGFGSGGGPTTTQRMIFGYKEREPYIDAVGNEWLPGTEFVIRSGRVVDPVRTSWWSKPVDAFIDNTADPDIYRYGVHGPEFWVNVTVGPGKYYARLKFAATHDIDYDVQGTTILINGKEVITKMNVDATAGGKNRAVDLVFNDIEPHNGIIEIRFVGNLYANSPGCITRGEAFVQAIEVGLGNGGEGAVPISIEHDPTLDTPKSNLLKNSGFEEGGVELYGGNGEYKQNQGWTCAILVGGRSYIWNESANVRTESGLPEVHSCDEAIRTYTEGNGHTRIYQDVAVEPNSSYSASIWVRATNLKGDGFGRDSKDSAGLILEELDKDDKIVVSHSKIELKTDSPYKKLEKNFKTSHQTVKIRYILDTIIGCHYAKGHVTYDDCELVLH